MHRAKQLTEKQRRFLDELEKGEKAVEIILQDQRIGPRMLQRWLTCRRFNRAVKEVRQRMAFRMEQDLTRGATRATMRLNSALEDKFDPRAVQMQAFGSALKLFHTMVRSPALKREYVAALEAMRQRRAESALPGGYHRSVSPERALALLKRLQKRRARDERLDRDQDENGRWMHSD